MTQVKLIIVSGKNIRFKGSQTNCSLYCKFYWKNIKHKTPVVKNKKQPAWNSVFCLSFDEKREPTDIRIELWKHKSLSHNISLAYTDINLAKLISYNRCQSDFSLKGDLVSGALNLSFEFLCLTVAKNDPTIANSSYAAEIQRMFPAGPPNEIIRYGLREAPIYNQPAAIPGYTGKRKALLIGINYIDTPNLTLNGCISDVHRMKSLLIQVYGFVDSSTTMVCLTDDSKDPLYLPTRHNILTAMRWLTSDNKSGDVFFFHFSGHGNQSIDRTGMESDGFNETICPCDVVSSGDIIDDVTHQCLVMPLQSGARLTAVMDCCHSGNGLDLPFTWDHFNWNWVEDKNPFYTPGDIQMFSGCADRQSSQEVARSVLGRGGIMTIAFVTVLSQNPFNHSYPSFLQALTDVIKSRGIPQRPELSSSQKFNFCRPFNLTDIIPNQNLMLGRAYKKEPGVRYNLEAPYCRPIFF